MADGRVATSVHAAFSIAVVGLLTWASGQPFVFPSLGPSAFVLALEPRGDRARTFRIVGAHSIGAVAGLLAYSLLATGITLTGTLVPLSSAGFRLGASAVLSIALTSWGMIRADAIHAPACATTLIVALGLLSTPRQVAIIIASVVVLVGTHRLLLRLFEAVAEKGPFASG